MSRSNTAITVEKTLHKENAFVLSMAYMSATKPILQETVQEGMREAEGPKAIRRSQDNGKTWEVTGADDWEDKRGDRTARRDAGNVHIDQNNGIVIQFFSEMEYGPEGDYEYFGAGADGSPLQSRTGKIFYHFSKDEGKTWGPMKQLIQSGPDYDAIHWADGIYYEKNMGFFGELFRVTQLRDGTLIVPMCFILLGEDGKTIKWADRFGEAIWPIEMCATFRGRWREDMSDIDWEMSNHVTTEEHMSRILCEPAVAEMDDGTLMMVMRGACSALQVMPGLKFYAISRDGGKSWGPVVPLTYPDGSFVNSPSSLPNFFRCSKNGKVYLIANIVPEPCRNADPRFPLKIVEIDQTYFWPKRETETVIATRQEHHPKFVRFSNWQRIEDQITGNPVIYMTDDIIDGLFHPVFPGGTFEPDAYRYEIKVPD
jgi:hypothetical protein